MKLFYNLPEYADRIKNFEFPQRDWRVWRILLYMQRFRWWRWTTRGGKVGCAVGSAIALAFVLSPIAEWSAKDKKAQIAIDGAVGGTAMAASASVGAAASTRKFLKYRREDWNQHEVLKGSRRLHVEDLSPRLLYAHQHQRPLLKVGELPIPDYLRCLHGIICAKTGSGKTQVLCSMLSQLRQEPNLKVVVISDAEGDLMKRFWRRGDLIFNPEDARSVRWSHAGEIAAGVNAMTIADALISKSESDEEYWRNCAVSAIADILSGTKVNSNVAKLLSQDVAKLHQILKSSGYDSARHLEGNKGDRAASILSSVQNALRFYDRLPNPIDESFSFFAYAQGQGRWQHEHPWLFIPKFRDSEASWQVLNSLVSEMLIKGALSRHGSQCQLLIIFDELDATQAIPSLPNLYSEGRKNNTGVTVCIQTISQLDKKYGKQNRAIILNNSGIVWSGQNTDLETATAISDCMGKNLSRYKTRSFDASGQKTMAMSEHVHNIPVVDPAEIQSLKPLNFFVRTSYGASLIQVPYREYPEAIAPRILPEPAQPTKIESEFEAIAKMFCKQEK